MEKRNELYRGKAKSVYTTDDPDRLVLLFRNDTSAFDGKKIEQLDRKGMVNNRFNAFIMQKLEEAGIPTQFDALLSDNECLVKKLDMIPVECVVRNFAAGSLVKRLGVEEGMALTPPTFELFLKDDAKGDPFINQSHVVTFGWATAEQLARMQELTLKINDILKGLFDAAGLLLVDFKLEFGLFKGEIVLGDEFSPDGCRLWDKETRKKMDKDRFRQGLGGVIEAYEEVAHRLGVPLP
ncbi:MAG: phosphoribosylaminoimidazolesuccinocarboxamide synthase [Pseudomonadales bacterium]|jgi:phosphoribosylaminoimidazole-succinocarboxamide synthase|uniref:Phosphoribosylaminoimidazole-succinocarboxamide synthase n=1 Tax=Halopseudomonas aestusnigri TaxID=857252 RepID=A0AAQ1JQD7_9GAMM|nr:MULTISPECIES: phosphoribosylaminoimidazolesuccinocarboxamide synthase [Halopseudomonas]MAK73495.1 phosphoribosylaminoimidazolesuccinocarboxamide synthase [Pseudomonadales bacterium]MEE2798066.1 phosphoribosylaminoimidazolesuccinocarboxamide synthase [Pseudomonadota bacterium]MAS67637.1 phosphoribosylaminoimidazolesuccinocarboxamide synthase [Pseudomonadales bacterium]MAY07869.1 phosphoribosylaminoimidazolesuccinocarboxamide synthase [Pseudomonadales bacterium]MBP74830.1 phosphoribosylaminoi|tara:strand:+ start:7229 stop:7942 length:714 start_codon:yes stop_codon:yes gene_type:complete